MKTGEKKQANRLMRLSKVKATSNEIEAMDTVKASMRRGDRRSFKLLMEAQHYWSRMSRFREERERCKRYAYNDQWSDTIVVDGKEVTEEEYIRSEGNVPLKNNIIKKLIRSLKGVYRSQDKVPMCVARDRDEQRYGETMTSVLQCNWDVNDMRELNATSFEDFLLGGLVVHRKSYGWRNGKLDGWTDIVQSNNFFIDNNMRDPRGWDVTMLGEVRDISFGQLVEQFAKSPEDYKRLKEIYRQSSDESYLIGLAQEFGYNKARNYEFLLSSEPGMCRVVEIWRKEMKARWRCHDYAKGDVYKIELEDYQEKVVEENERRRAMAMESGLDPEDVALIEADWMIDHYWYYYFLSPTGDILDEGETPYEHGEHPYVFKAYPFVDGEVHSFVGDIVDQQRYINRLIILYDWIMRASAKGLLLFPEDAKPDDMSMEEIADEWGRFNGMIIYKAKPGVAPPQQISNNSTNIGITELLNVQLRLIEDISGVSGALQGKPGFSGMSASLYNQQTQNATTSLLDILESFDSFIVNAAKKDVKNLQQFYDSRRVVNIVGRGGEIIEYDPAKIRNVDFDLTIVESAASPTYRERGNEILMRLWERNAITAEMLLEHGDFPFGDKLLQSLRSQRQQVENGELPDNISPELLEEARGASDGNAAAMLDQALRG